MQLFIDIVIAIAVISVLLALLSLRKILKEKEVKGAKEELAKGRVVFHSGHHSSK